MTAEPTDPLPGLPQKTPEPDAPIELNDQEVCTLNLTASILQLCQSMLTANPHMNPADAAAVVGEIVAKTLRPTMPGQAMRLGLLVAFEQAHDAPMSFIDINHAKQALERLADRRRKADKVTPGGVIIPGKD